MDAIIQIRTVVMSVPQDSIGMETYVWICAQMGTILSSACVSHAIHIVRHASDLCLLNAIRVTLITNSRFKIHARSHNAITEPTLKACSIHATIATKAARTVSAPWPLNAAHALLLARKYSMELNVSSARQSTQAWNGTMSKINAQRFAEMASIWAF
jgi:hypothetical protein